MRTRPWARRHPARLPLVLAGAAIAALLPAAPSHAVTNILSNTNMFEGINSPPVSFEHTGSGNGFMVLTDPANADSFNGYAVIVTTPGNFSSVRTDMALLQSASCSLSVMVNPFGHTESVNVEIIDPTTWTYTALKTVTLSGNTWQRVAMSFRTTATVRQDQIFRVSVVDPVLPAPATTPPFALAHVDSLRESCTNTG